VPAIAVLVAGICWTGLRIGRAIRSAWSKVRELTPGRAPIAVTHWTDSMGGSKDGRSAIRILVNGYVVNISSDIGGYDVRGGTAVSYPLTAGDGVKVQYNRISQFGTTIFSGAASPFCKRGRPCRDSVGASFAVSYGVMGRINWAELVGPAAAVGWALLGFQPTRRCPRGTPKG